MISLIGGKMKAISKTIFITIIVLSGTIIAQNNQHVKHGETFPVGIFSTEIGSDPYYQKIDFLADGLNSEYRGFNYFQSYERSTDATVWTDMLQGLDNDQRLLIGGTMYDMFVDTTHGEIDKSGDYDDVFINGTVNTSLLNSFLNDLLSHPSKSKIGGFYLADEPFLGRKPGGDRREFVYDLQAYNELVNAIRNHSLYDDAGYPPIFVALGGYNGDRVAPGSHPYHTQQSSINWAGQEMPQGSLGIETADSVTWQNNTFTTWYADAIMIDAYKNDLTVWDDLIKWAKRDAIEHTNRNIQIHPILPAIYTWQSPLYDANYPNHKEMHRQVRYLMELGIDGLWFFSVRAFDAGDSALGTGWNAGSGHWQDGDWTEGNWSEAVANQVSADDELILATTNCIYMIDWIGMETKGARIYGSSDIKTMATGHTTNSRTVDLNADVFWGRNNVVYANDMHNDSNDYLVSRYNVNVTAMAAGDIGSMRNGTFTGGDENYDGYDEMFIGYDDGEVIVNYNKQYDQYEGMTDINESLYDQPYTDNCSGAKRNSKVTSLATGRVIGHKQEIGGEWGPINVNRNFDLLIGHEDGVVNIYNGYDYVGYMFGRSGIPVNDIVVANVIDSTNDQILMAYNDGRIYIDDDGLYGNTVMLHDEHVQINCMDAGYMDYKWRKNVVFGTNNGKVIKFNVGYSNNVENDTTILNRPGTSVIKIHCCDINGDGVDEIISAFSDGEVYKNTTHLLSTSNDIVSLASGDFTTDLTGGVSPAYHYSFDDIEGRSGVVEVSLANALPKAVTLEEEGLPTEYSLGQNYPNPFNPNTIIKYDLPKESYVIINIYNVLGERVRTLVDEIKSAGRYSVKFDASSLSSGVYIYSMQAGSYRASNKMLLIK